mmetsp:Transcript_10350/g.21553  ORF Transcript_10350/g.21553 Transcript_10350/m.21553 type:complete len:426 (+) Transcript_10350:623-1900(+)
MPSRTKLAASTDVGFDINTAAFEPRQTSRSCVTRTQRDFKSTITIEERGVLTIELNAFFANHKVRNFRSVLASRKLLLNHEIFGIVLGWQTLEFVNNKGIFLPGRLFFLDLAHIGRVHCTGGGVIAGCEPKFVVLFGIDRATILVANLCLCIARRYQRQSGAIVSNFVKLQFGLDSVGSGQEQIILGDSKILVRGFRRGLKKNLVVDSSLAATPKGVKVTIDDGSLLVRDSVVLWSPVGTQLNKQHVSNIVQRGILLDFHFFEFWLGEIGRTILGFQQVIFRQFGKPVLARVKGDAARMDLPDASSPVAFVRNVSIDRDIGLFSFKNDGSLLERGSARPFLDDSRVSRICEGSFSKIRSHQKQITSLVGDAGLCLADVKGAVFLADKLFGGQIKFLDVHGIGSSAGQLEECSRDNFSVGRISGSR